MENSINKVVLSGYAGTDVDVKVFGSQKLARVNLAVNGSYKNSLGEEVKKTQWFSLNFWNSKADVANVQIKKGSRITIEGRLQTNVYDAKDGSKRYTIDIVVTDFVTKENVLVN